MRPRLPTVDSYDYEEYDGEGAESLLVSSSLSPMLTALSPWRGYGLQLRLSVSLCVRLCVRVFAHAVKAKRLELSTPLSADI